MTKSLRITGKNSDGEYWLHIEGATQSAGLNLGDPQGMICSALLMAASGHTYIRKDAPELVALVAAVNGLRILDLDEEEAIITVHDARRLHAARLAYEATQ